MSITDELRGFADDWDWLDPKAGEFPRKLRAIADRIDAEHEEALSQAYMDVSDSEWVRLPKDADGEYIHVGERVQLIGNDPSTVSHMSLADDGWRVYVKYDGGIGTGSGEPKRIRHHHAPTVEDVLREFAEAMNENMGMYTGEAIDADEWRMADERTIAKYAAKLRLAEEDA